ncbi:sensor histidine kinase [Hymenobacter latericus]|uniref:sensor histidine kinase n=1 Tax=Hymenobacter sp. YIM 151858-1 TaxID=2987688 RepID=UPI002226C733|nr:histidine kinase [Hymenobacter sp. YIM 151858-1]UYZ57385.1 histidine kinase [Hymenobacter sp. YIM 151858-1]
MRRSPLFYLLVLGLALLMAVYTRLIMASRPEEFYLFPDAPFWLFLQALLAVTLLDALNRRWLARGQVPQGAGYYFRLLGWGALAFVALLLGAEALLKLLHLGQPYGPDWYPHVRSFFSNLFLYLLVSGLYLPFLYQQHAAAAQTELERLGKEAARAQLHALQQHVDPHFLFNNLNILAALIEPGNAPARDYVVRLAEVYRYLVRTRAQEVVPLAEELAFARDYCHLLRCRFGAAYQFAEDVQLPAAELAQLLVPPGAVQELLTNAVKHNVGSRSRPLAIRLLITPRTLVVQNELRPRPTPADGTGSGLAGLRARVALVAAEPLRVEATAETYTVTLPLTAALPLPAHAHPVA